MPFGQKRQARDWSVQPRDGAYQSLIMKISWQLEHMYTVVLVHRTFIGLISVSLVILCLWYIPWEPLQERLFAWMRWHFWAYPGS